MLSTTRKIALSVLIPILAALVAFALWKAMIPKPKPAVASVAIRMLNVPILIYHSVLPHESSMKPSVKNYTVSPQAFDQQLQYLKDNGYAVISFASLIDAMTHASTTLPPHSVVLTFDDGWENQYRQAFPILKKYNDTATFFIFTNGPMSGNANFISWEQLKEMQDAGMDIESHSVSHPYLFTIVDQGALWKEIGDSRQILAAHLGKTPDIFAYPFGSYNDLDISILKAAGYKAARADLGWPTKNVISATTTDVMYKLNGTQITDDFARFLRAIQG